MINIIPFENDIFQHNTLNKQCFTSHTYVTSSRLVEKLMNIKLPIERRKALIRIFNFLNYVDSFAKENDTLSINKFKLESFFTRNHYREYMEILSQQNVIHKIKQDGLYNSFYYKKTNPKTGKKVVFANGKFIEDGDKLPAPFPTKYKIHKDYTTDNGLAIVILEEKKKKVSNFFCEVEGIDMRYQNTIKNMNLNIPNAIKAEIENWKEKQLSSNVLRKRISRILGTLKDRKIKKGKKVDRIYHSFTNLSRVAREFLNKKFHSEDIVNCQPLLLVAYLKQNKYGVDKEYQDDCENGRFYENFYKLSSLKTIDDKRSKVKSSIFKNLFFGFYVESKYNKRFRELYPETWKSLNAISKTDTSLATRLQNLEAELFNNLKPKYSKYFYTLFDAIYYTNAADKKQLTKEIKDFFGSLNISVQIK